MAKRTISIDIPQVTGKNKIITAGSGYVYLQTDYEWDKEKRQPVYKRYSIGRIDPSDNTKLFPGKNFETYFGPVDPEVTQLRKIYCSAERREAGKLNYHISYGPYAAVLKSCELAGCLEPLQRAFPLNWPLIMAMVTEAIVAEKTTSQTFPGWCFDNYCGLDRVVSDSEVSAMYKAIEKDNGGIKVFLTLFNEKYNKLFPSADKRLVGFDSTNQNTYGEGITMASEGHEKIELGLPIINTAMFVDEETGIPLWYEHYDGSLLDKSQTPFSLKKIIDLGYRKLFAIYDRGYYSEKCLKEMSKMKEIGFGVLCPDGLTWVDDLIKSEGPKIKDRQEYYVFEENVYASRNEVILFDRPYYAYLFYDAQRAEDERMSIHEAVAYFFGEASKRKRYSEKMAAHFAPRGIIVVKCEKDEKTGKNYKLLEDAEMIQELLDKKGFFVMISPEKMTANEAIRIVRRRDKSEKSFQKMMSHFGLRNTYRHEDETFKGMMFMAFIALVTLCGFMHFETDILHQMTSETVARLFAELNKYKIEENRDLTWRPAYAMNKKQKDIFAKLSLTEEDIIAQVERISIRPGQVSLPG